MILPAVSAGDVALLAVYGLVLWLPGGIVAVLAGLRGWTLAAVAPLVTYGLVGLAGPASSALGWRWSVVPLLVTTAIAGLVSAVWHRRRPVSVNPHTLPPIQWRPAAHVAVGLAVAGAAALAAVAVLVGMGGLRTIPQDWDAALHANGIRWIAETGDAGLDAMTRVNWYELPQGLFYPNAYHLVAVVAYQLTGASIPAVLNAGTIATLALLALGVAALVRRCGGRAVHAGSAALLVVAATGFYDMLWRGPLLPFAMGVALLPAGLVLTLDLLDRPRRGVVVFVLGLGGALALHPGVLVTLVLLAAPMVVLRRSVRDLGVALAAGVVTALLYAAQLAGSLRSAAGPAVDWPADLTPAAAVGQVLLFSHNAPLPQWWLAAALVAGLVAYRALPSPLRWVGPAAGLVAALFVAAASYDAPWAEALTRPWWNDRYRFAGIVVVPLAILAGHGVAEAARRLAAAVTRRPAARLVAAVGVLAVLGALSGGFYLGRNEAAMRHNTGDGPAVSPGEVAGYRVLATMVAPTERVMNDRGDGSVWMYALDGVHPVSAHYDPTDTGPDATLLADRFDDYDTDPAVRAAAARLRVRWVVVGQGFLRADGPDAAREPGLAELDRVRALRQVWGNGALTIYRLGA